MGVACRLALRCHGTCEINAEQKEKNKVDDIRELLLTVNGKLDALVARETVHETYSTREFADRVGLAEWTVRNYCRLGRLNARKKKSGRGLSLEWTLQNEELERFRREGLLIQRLA